jgi:alpha-beta hydrolase superfamily lysophospholipase
MSHLIEKTGTFTTSDDLEIFYRYFAADNERCSLVITHGLGMNSNCYQTVIEHLVPKGVSIWAFDLRGHGKSDGARGFVNNFDEYLFDLKEVIEMANRERKEGTKTFLLGDSLGGLISLKFALNYPDVFDGLILASPGLGGAKIPAIKMMIAKVLFRFIPTFTIPHGLDFSKSCHNKEWIKSFDNDPLNHNKGTARLATEALRIQSSTFQDIPGLTVPILMQIPGDDHLVSADISKAFYGKLTLEDKTLHFYNTFYHFIFNEPSDMRNIALGDLTKWIEAHI